MKGTIRLVVGLVLLMGGVGGIEQDMSSVFPLYPTLIAFFGLGLFAWGALAAARAEHEI